jgi:hypothetical protein
LAGKASFTQIKRQIDLIRRFAFPQPIKAINSSLFVIPSVRANRSRIAIRDFLLPTDAANNRSNWSKRQIRIWHDRQDFIIG